jgi:DNA topoisomerase I
METTIARVRRIPENTIRKILSDPQASAKAVNLIYVSDKQEGIRRLKAGKGFRYTLADKTIKDKAILQRIRSLVIPPAWTNVWICTKENGHLQVTGLDVKGRKQYRYHPLWNQLRNHTKFYRMLDFGRALPGIRRRLRRDLALKGMVREKILATIVALMERTSIRIGNEEYEKANGSIGLTTMKNKHVTISGSSVKFNFIGKKGKAHLISLKSKRLSGIVRHCREIPGRELFQYLDDEGQTRPVDSGLVNDYIREISGSDFTAKDFRTWAGTVHCLVGLKACEPAENGAVSKKNFMEVLDRVSAHLGNTRTVCKKYYVHPCLEEMYISGTLQSYLDKLELKNSSKKVAALSPEEKMVMTILRKAA